MRFPVSRLPISELELERGLYEKSGMGRGLYETKWDVEGVIWEGPFTNEEGKRPDRGASARVAFRVQGIGCWC